jgi:hypothetical protein
VVDSGRRTRSSKNAVCEDYVFELRRSSRRTGTVKKTNPQTAAKQKPQKEPPKKDSDVNDACNSSSVSVPDGIAPEAEKPARVVVKSQAVEKEIIEDIERSPSKPLKPVTRSEARKRAASSDNGWQGASMGVETRASKRRRSAYFFYFDVTVGEDGTGVLFLI